MKKPIVKNYSGQKKKIQKKLFSKRVRKEGKTILNERSSMPASESLQKDKITYSFFESFFYQKLYNSNVAEYYFSSTRKGYNYYGIIVKIFKNKEDHLNENSELLFAEEGIKLYRTVFDGSNFKDFSEHIRYLGQEEYVIKFKDMDGIYGTGTYPYTATELQFHINGNEKIGDFFHPDLYKIITKEFYDSRLKYFLPESFALFCALEQLPLTNEYVALLLYELFQYCYTINNGLYPSLTEWWSELENEGIIDLQSYSKGINGDLLFKNFPLKEINKKDSVQIFSPTPYLEELRVKVEYGTYYRSFEWNLGEHEARILKVNNFRNSGLNYWFLYATKNKSNMDNIDYILDRFEKSGIKINE